MTIINKVGQKIFNSKGCRLVKKMPDIPLSELKGIVPPENYTKVLYSKIETNYGKGLTTVISFFDKEGLLIERYIDKQVGNLFERTVSKYNGKWDSVFGRTKQSVKSVNGVVVKKENAISCYDSDSKVLYRQRLTANIDKDGASLENQLFENLAPQKKRQFLQTTAKKNKDGKIVRAEASSNFMNEKKLKELQKFPYLYYLNYTNDDFVYAIAPYAEKLQKVENRGIKIQIKELEGSKFGECSIYSRQVYVDAKKCKTKSKLVEVINHEYRHLFQEWLAENYEGKNAPLSSMHLWKNRKKPQPQPILLNPEEKEYAKKCSQNFKNYVLPSDENYEDYFRQFVEKDGRFAAKKAKDEYNLGVIKIDNAFNRAKLKLLGYTKQKASEINRIYKRIDTSFS